MKALQQVYGIFKKELALQGRFHLSVFNRLLLGPVISAICAGLLYAGFFRANPDVSLGGFGAQNFTAALLFGFLAHLYVNSGYYIFPSKILGEWQMRTLPLLWMVPCHPVLLVLGFCSVEALRCLGITIVALGLLAFGQTPGWGAWPLELLYFVLLFVFGLGLGFLRSCLLLANEGKVEIADYFYLALIFLSCFYIPKELLPQFFWPLCEWNPAFHGVELMRGAWKSGTVAWSSLAILMGGMCVLGAACLLVWEKCRFQIMERSYG